MVRFVKTRPSVWQGNGFGTDRAEWVALIGDIEVGRFENNGRLNEAFGSYPMTSSTTAWKKAVRDMAAGGKYL